MEKLVNIFLILMMYATWSSVFPLSKMALEYSTPLFITGIRMLFSGVALLIFLLIKDPKSLLIKKQHFFPILILSVFSIYITNFLESWSIQYLSSVKTCFIYGLSPFLALILSYIHFNERISFTKFNF